MGGSKTSIQEFRALLADYHLDDKPLAAGETYRSRRDALEAFVFAGQGAESRIAACPHCGSTLRDFRRWYEDPDSDDPPLEWEECAICGHWFGPDERPEWANFRKGGPHV